MLEARKLLPAYEVSVPRLAAGSNLNSTTITPARVRQLLRARCEQAGSQSGAGRKLGLHQPYINDVISGKRPPSDDLCAALFIERVVSYRKIKPDEE